MMQRETYTVAQLIEKLQQMPQDALVIGPLVDKAYGAIDFIELFENKDIRTGMLRNSPANDPAIVEYTGPFVYIDCIDNLVPWN